MMDLSIYHSLDTKMKLLAGQPIEVPEVGSIKPFKLHEVAEIGYMEFSKNLNSLTLDVKKTLGEENAVRNGIEINPFDVFSHIQDESFKETFISGIKMFMRNDKVLHTTLSPNENQVIDIIILGIDDVNDLDIEASMPVIHRGNFSAICEVLKLQNGLKGIVSDSKKRTKGKRAKELEEKLRKSQETVDRLKRNKKGSDGEIDIVDIISAVSSKSNSVSPDNIWNLTLFQLYDHYKRLHAINQYEVNLQAIMNGAEGIELIDWSAKLE